MKNQKKIQNLLDELVNRFENPEFVLTDPISVPRLFTKKQDIEIAAFITATFAWGQRKTIIAKANAFLDIMGKSPHDFIVNHKEKDRARFEHFVHRTFQPLDGLYFLDRLQRHYQKYDSLEMLFAPAINEKSEHVGPALSYFHEQFFDVDYAPQRTRKHVATPDRNSSCKRLNMLLRWLVRSDDAGVDLALWKNISPKQLLIPLDIHVQRISKRFGLLERKQVDWKAAVDLSALLKTFDKEDPGKYDFALFGLGIHEQKYGKLELPL